MASKKADPRSESIEEYLEAIIRISDSGERVTTSSISSSMAVSPASVSEFLRKLTREGYIRHMPYRDIALTQKGERLGRRVLRKHRLIERFLDTMGLSSNRIHPEACKLEHYVSDELEGLMKKRLEPERSGRGILSLVDLKGGEEGRIFIIGGGRASRARLEDLGLTPGTTVRILRSAPFSGPVQIRVRGSSLAIGRGMAKKIFLSVGSPGV